MSSRSAVALFLTILAVTGCERARKSPAVAQTGNSAAAPPGRAAPVESTHSAPARERARDWETWIPQWQLALRHPDTLPIELVSPGESCTRRNEPVDAHLDDARPKLRVQVTQGSFEAIAVAHGFIRRGNAWVTIGTDSAAVAAIPDSVSEWRILRGGWYGRQAPVTAGRVNGSTVDPNIHRHAAMFATRQHASGCTVVLS